MKNQIQTGVNLTIPAPANIKSGGNVLAGKLFGIAAEDALQGASVDIVTLGVFAMRKSGGEDFEVGDVVYYNPTLDIVSGSLNGDVVRIGIAVKAAAASAATVEVRLDGQLA